MATTKTKESKWEMMSITIPLERDRQDDVYVAVDGVGSYLIRRGEQVEVPEPIYKILKESMDIETANIRKQQKLSAEFLGKK